MSWQSLTFNASGPLADAASEILMDLGAVSVTLNDAFADTDRDEALFGEPGMPQMPLWQQSEVSALFDPQADVAAVMTALFARMQIAPFPYQVTVLADQDWVRVTQMQHDPIQVTAGLWIVPSWHEIPAAAETAILLDPGLAFGTGSHPTTRLCLQWIEQSDLTGAHLLDYGSGSGILAIAAALKEAAEVVGADIDPQANEAATSNAALNGVTARFCLPEALPAQPFDILVANILANPLIMLEPEFARRLRPGGTLVLSGLLEDQVAAIQAAYATNFSFVGQAMADGWVRLVAVKGA